MNKAFPLEEIVRVKVGGIQCVTTVQLRKNLKLPDWSDTPYSQTLVQLKKNANKVQAIPVQGWPSFLLKRADIDDLSETNSDASGDLFILGAQDRVVMTTLG